MPWKEQNMIDKRTEFALRSLQPNINFSELCEEYGVSRKTGYKWKSRFQSDGASAMLDRSRRPKASPAQLSERALCRINRIHHRHPHWGPRKIRAIYLNSYREAPSESSFKRVFEKSGWTRKRRMRKSGQSGRVSSGRIANGCNEVWTVDFKGWWRTGDGQRCEPLTVRDEHSRFILEIRSMSSCATEAVRTVFERLFDQYGLPEAIRSDNGPPFASASAVLGLSRLAAWWVALGIDLERGRPGKPQDNGAHERMHLDIVKEIQAYAKGNPREQQAAMDIWRETFNKERPHEALGMAMPADAYAPSPRRYEGTPSDIEYAGMLTRKVSKRGYISVDKRKIPVSTALQGWSVGLRPIDDDHYEVRFANIGLGEIELSTSAFLGLASETKEGIEPQHKTS
jgi:putative transposase